MSSTIIADVDMKVSAALNIHSFHDSDYRKDSYHQHRQDISIYLATVFSSLSWAAFLQRFTRYEDDVAGQKHQPKVRHYVGNEFMNAFVTVSDPTISCSNRNWPLPR